MIEVRISNGDSAEAETPEEALYAAAVLIREAATSYYARPTATFVVDGTVVARDQGSRDLGHHVGQR